MTGFTSANKWTPFVLAVLMLTAAAGQRADAQRRGGPDANSPSRELIFTEALRIGDERAGDSVLFGYVLALAIDSKGQIYLTDNGFNGIRMFSGEGAFIREIGRGGMGPGEFAVTPSVHIGPEDSLYAWDRVTTRLSIFSPHDQSLVASIAVGQSRQTKLTPLAFLGATNRGLLMEYSTAYVAGSNESLKMAHFAKHVRWNGTVATDNVAQLPARNFVFIETESTAGIRYLPSHLAARPHFALSADQVLYYGMDDAIDITGVALDGAKRHRITLPHVPVFVTRAERAASVNSIRIDDVRKKVSAKIPANKPAFIDLLLDDAGHVWIRLSRQESGQTTTWLVLGNSGVVVAQANVPRGVRLLAVRGGRAFGAMTIEETGVPTAVAWDIDL